MVKFEKVIERRIIKVQNLLKALHISPPQKMISVTSILFLVICIMTVTLYIYNYNEEDAKRIVQLHTFGAMNSFHDDRHFSPILYHFHYFIVSYEFFFTCHFALFYTIICCYMTIILSRHIEICRSTLTLRSITHADCDSCFIRYDTIISAFKEINSNLSYPAFLGSTYQAFGVLLATLNIIKRKFIFFPMKIFCFCPILLCLLELRFLLLQLMKPIN